MNTREIILQKTLRLLLEKGYRGVSVSDIQQSTGMARGLLYHYFGSQDRLFEEAVQELLDKWMANKEELRDCSIAELIVFIIGRYQQLLEYLELNYESKISVGHVHLLLLGAAQCSTVLADLLRCENNERSACWKMAVLNSFSRGELRNGLNLESVARHFLYLEEGTILISGLTKSPGELIYNLEKTWIEFHEIIKRS